MNTRRFWISSATALILFSACSCTRTNPASGGANISVVDKIRSTKRLRAAYVVYPPFVGKSGAGAPTGYFIDLMAQIAEAGGFTVEYEEAKWGTMVAGLESGRYDIVVSGIFPTISRSFSASFPEPVMYVGLSGVVPIGDKRKWTPDMLKQSGLRIAVVNGEVGHEYVRRYLPDAKVIVLDTADITRSALEVQQGRADIAIAEAISMTEFSARNPGVRPVFIEEPLQTYGCTFMIRRGDPDWLAFINTSVSYMQASGVVEQLNQKYKKRPDMWHDRTPPWR